MKTFTRKQPRRSRQADVRNNGTSECSLSASYEFEEEELLVEGPAVITDAGRRNTDKQPIDDAPSLLQQTKPLQLEQDAGRSATPAKRKSLFHPVERIAASQPQGEGQAAGIHEQAAKASHHDAYMFPPESPEYKPDANTQPSRKRNVRMPSPSTSLSQLQQQPRDVDRDVEILNDNAGIQAAVQKGPQKTASGRLVKHPPEYNISPISRRAKRWTTGESNGASSKPSHDNGKEQATNSPVASSPFATATAVQQQKPVWQALGLECSPNRTAEGSTSIEFLSLTRREGRRQSAETASLVDVSRTTSEKQKQEDTRKLPGPVVSSSLADQRVAKRQKRSHSLDTMKDTVTVSENIKQRNNSHASYTDQTAAAGKGLSQLLSQAFSGGKTQPSAPTGKRVGGGPVNQSADIDNTARNQKHRCETLQIGSAPSGYPDLKHDNMLPDLTRCATAPSVLESSPASSKPVTRPTRPPLLPKASRSQSISRQNSGSKIKGDNNGNATASNTDAQGNKARVRFNTEAVGTGKVMDKSNHTAVFKDVSLPNPIRTPKPQAQDNVNHSDSSPNSSSPSTPSGVLRGRLGLPGLKTVSQAQQGLIADQEGGLDILSFSQMQSIAEAQETGEALALQDEASYALDGLSPGCSLNSHRECLSQLATMIATRKGRSALRAEGLAQRVISAAYNLHAESDSALAVSAATVLVSLALPDAHGSYLASQDALKLAGRLLQAPAFTQSAGTVSGTSNSSSHDNDALQCAIKLLVEGPLSRHIMPLLGHAGIPLNSVLPVVAIALGAATTTDAAMVKYSELTKQNMRVVGLLDQVATAATARLAEVEEHATAVMTTNNQPAANCQGPEPNHQDSDEATHEGVNHGDHQSVNDISTESNMTSMTDLLRCLTELRLLLQVLENATFTCPSNEQALLDMQVPVPPALSSEQLTNSPFNQVHLRSEAPNFVDVLIRCVTTISHLFTTSSHIKTLSCSPHKCDILDSDSHEAGDQGTAQQSYANLFTACNQLLQVTLGLLMNLTHNHVEARKRLAVSGGYTTLLQLLSWCAGVTMAVGTQPSTTACRQDIVRHVELLTVCIGLLINSISTDPVAQQQVRQLTVPCTTPVCAEVANRPPSYNTVREIIPTERPQQCASADPHEACSYQVIPLLCAILTAVMTSGTAGDRKQSNAVATTDIIITGSPAQPSNNMTRPKTFSRTRQRLSGQSLAEDTGPAQQGLETACDPSEKQDCQQQELNDSHHNDLQLEEATLNTSITVNAIAVTQQTTVVETVGNIDAGTVDGRLESNTMTVTVISETAQDTTTGAHLQPDTGRAPSNGQQQPMSGGVFITGQQPSGQQSQETVHDAGEASIVQVYASMLLGFLIQDCPAAQQQACQLLPGGNLAAVLASISHMLHFYVQAGAITDTSKEAVVQLLQRLAPLVEQSAPTGNAVEAAAVNNM